MIDRLEKFEAPRSPWDLLPGALLLAIGLAACGLDYESAKTNEKIVTEAAGRVAPLSYPLGCPERDDMGRSLTATLSIKGEKRPRCYYGNSTFQAVK